MVTAADDVPDGAPVEGKYRAILYTGVPFTTPLLGSITLFTAHCLYSFKCSPQDQRGTAFQRSPMSRTAYSRTSCRPCMDSSKEAASACLRAQQASLRNGVSPQLSMGTCMQFSSHLKACMLAGAHRHGQDSEPDLQQPPMAARHQRGSTLNQSRQAQPPP